MSSLKDRITLIRRHLHELSKDIDNISTEMTSLIKEKMLQYEKEYILPCFKWAEEDGIDLHQLVRENPGHNCVELYVQELRKRNPPKPICLVL